MDLGPQRRAAHSHWGWAVLFMSSSTLICCALPILLVTLGLGAVSAALFEGLPFLGVVVQHKLWLFIGSAAVLALGGWALFRPGRYCPSDPELAAKCEAAHHWNLRLWRLSVVMWVIGFFAAYLSLPLYEFFAG